MDMSVLIACDNGIHNIESLNSFLNATENKLTENNTLIYEEKSPFLRTKGAYSTFLNSGNGKVTSLKHIGKNFFNLDSFAPHTSNTTKQTVIFTDAVRIDGLVYFMIDDGSEY